MTNQYYGATGAPGDHAVGSSAQIRAELLLLQAAFDKVVPLTGNALKLVRVNAAGTSQEGISAIDAIPIGSTTPSTGAFTTISASGAITGSLTGNVTGNVSGSSGSTTGNAATATVLQTARAINGTPFNGSADITVSAAAGTLTGGTLAAGVTVSSLTQLGTVAIDFSVSRSNAGGAVLSTLSNSSTAGTANARQLIQVGGAAAGDAFITMAQSGGQSWSIGLDTSDSSSFVIAGSSVLGTSNALRISAAGAVTVPGALGVTGTTTLGVTTIGASSTDTITVAGTFGGGGRLQAGTYTPTVTAVTNCTSPTAFLCHFTRLNDIVRVDGLLSISITAVTATQVDVSLPIASNFTTVTTDLIGIGTAPPTIAVRAQADISNDRAQLLFNATGTGGLTVHFGFSYRVLP